MHPVVVDLSKVDAFTEAPAIAIGLREAAQECGTDRPAIAARMLIAAHALDVLHGAAMKLEPKERTP